jgi:hypothetical protein
VPPPEPPPIDPLGTLAALAAHGVTFVLIGGVAANVHGYPLPTEDVDITPDPARSNLERLAAALRDLNARLRTAAEPDGVPFEVSADALARATVWTLTTDRGDLDVVVQPDGTGGYADLRRDSTEVDLGDGLTVRVASLADVIRSKEASGRAKDLAALPALRATLERTQRRP